MRINQVDSPNANGVEFDMSRESPGGSKKRKGDHEENI